MARKKAHECKREISQCPRCCDPDTVCDVLPDKAKPYLYKCTKSKPCVWRKTWRQTFHDHDMLVMAADRMMVAYEHFRAYNPRIGHLTHRITNPTSEIAVYADCDRIMTEVAENLRNALPEKPAGKP